MAKRKKFINVNPFTQHVFTDENGDMWKFEKINKSTDDGILKASEEEKENHKGHNEWVKRQMQTDSPSKFVRKDAIGLMLKDALYHHTVAGRLYGIFDEWWLQGVVYVDSEDLSTLSLPESLLNCEVKGMEDSFYHFTDNDGNVVAVPMTKIQI